MESSSASSTCSPPTTTCSNGTFMEARSTPESVERFVLALLNLDVREFDFPTTIESQPRQIRMATLNWWDAEDNGHPLVFNGDALQCQSLEELRLRCSFSGTARGDEGPVEITDGRLEVLLRTNAAADTAIEVTSPLGTRQSP